MFEYAQMILNLIFLYPGIIYFGSLQGILNGSAELWRYYVVLFPIIILLCSFLISKTKRFNSKKSLYLIPILIFLFLQIIPLPRSPYASIGGVGPSPRNEPFSVGIGYPFSIVKIFLDKGCLTSYYVSCYSVSEGQTYIKMFSNHTPDIEQGDIVILPEGMILNPFNWIGLFVYTYGLWLLINIKRLRQKTKQRSNSHKK